MVSKKNHQETRTFSSKPRTQEETSALRNGFLSEADIEDLRKWASDNGLSAGATEELVIIVKTHWKEEIGRVENWPLIAKIDLNHKNQRKKIKNLIKSIDDLLIESEIDTSIAEAISTTFEAERRYVLDVESKYTNHLIASRQALRSALEDIKGLRSQGQRTPPATERLTEAMIGLIQMDGHRLSKYADGKAHNILQAVFDFLCTRDPEANRYDDPVSAEWALKKLLSNKQPGDNSVKK